MQVISDLWYQSMELVRRTPYWNQKWAPALFEIILIILYVTHTNGWVQWWGSFVM